MPLLIIIGLVAIILGFRFIKKSKFRGYYKCLGCGQEKHWYGGHVYPDGEVASRGKFGFECKCFVHDFAQIGDLAIICIIWIIFGVLAIIAIIFFIFVILPILLWWP